jgi:outer membrane protein assembly factor BamE (lipoprotein component of BamABCDE complex)
MAGVTARRSRAFALAVLMLLAACSPVYRNHGYAPSDDELALLKVGVDTRETVAEAVGRPSAQGLLNDEAWYFVQSRWRQAGLRPAEELERQVVAISFDASGRVANIERFDLTDGQVVALSRRVTETNVKGRSALAQITGNIGRLNADQIVE